MIPRVPAFLFLKSAWRDGSIRDRVRWVRLVWFDAGCDFVSQRLGRGRELLRREVATHGEAICREACCGGHSQRGLKRRATFLDPRVKFFGSVFATPSSCWVSLTALLLLACEGAMAAEHTSGLQWARTETILRPPRTLPVVSTDFPFRNDGPVPVKIVALVPLCDCLKATTAKKEFAPGESGSIRIEVPVKASAERVVKALRVVTDQGGDTVLRLILETPGFLATASKTGTVPGAPPVAAPVAGTAKRSSSSPVTMRSHLVRWKVGAPVAEQSIDVVVAAGSKVTFGELRSGGSEFTARFVASPIWGVNRIVVTPQSTATAMSGTLRLEAMVDGQKRVYSARMVVE